MVGATPEDPTHGGPAEVAELGPGPTVLYLRGEHDAATVDGLAETLAGAIARDDADLVVDLSGVEFMDTATIGVIVRAQELLRLGSRSLALQRPSVVALRLLDELRGLTDAPVLQGVRVVSGSRPDHEVERMKSEFLSRIGHELRTPLTGIIGYAELLSAGRVQPDGISRCQEEILGLAYGLQRIVELLEFFAAAEAGRALLRTEPVGVLSLVEDVVDRWVERLPSGRISGLFPSPVPDVIADPRWLRISVNELIGNAVEYSPDGSPITVTATVVSNGSGPGAEIAVADRGGGMSAEDIERCFGEFVQGDGSDTRSHGGLGLGLSLVRRVAEAHGGTVAVESTVGKGSTFSIFLPSRPRESTPAMGAI